eukprot:COSAG01_NODE_63102_length_281_cov_0.879121_1_plen_49_part_10
MCVRERIIPAAQLTKTLRRSTDTVVITCYASLTYLKRSTPLSLAGCHSP